MSEDEAAIETAIREWARAVHEGDLERVVADRAADIVMFDVPPPQLGVRGIDAYAATWPPFFEFQRAGGSFEVQEVHVRAGADVAFAWALLICATEQERREQPEQRLRITFGLERRDDRWVVVHEHHSFPLVS
jgi:uncharacterized protein (TIGR02246 family)